MFCFLQNMLFWVVSLKLENVDRYVSIKHGFLLIFLIEFWGLKMNSLKTHGLNPNVIAEIQSCIYLYIFIYISSIYTYINI